METSVTVVPASIGPAQAAAVAWDVIVIGAGPAGAVSALLAARSGLSVLLIDRNRFPRPKVCGGCLNAHALAALGRAELLDRVRALGATDVGAIDLRRGSQSARLDLPNGLAVSRASLDAELVRAAIEAGVAFLPDTRAMVEEDRPSTVRPVSLHCLGNDAARATAQVILVADGLGHPSLRDCPDMLSDVDPRSRIGIGGSAPPGTIPTLPGIITMAIGRRGYAGAVGVEAGRQAIAAAVDPAFLKAHARPADAIRAIFAEARLTTGPELDSVDWTGTVPLTRRLRRPAAARVLVLGDAAGYVEPFTGEGMAWALADAEAAMPFVRQGLAGWDRTIEQAWVDQRAHRVARDQRWCQALAAVVRRPFLMAPLLTLLRQQPRLAQPMLAHLTPRASQR